MNPVVGSFSFLWYFHSKRDSWFHPKLRFATAIKDKFFRQRDAAFKVISWKISLWFQLFRQTGNDVPRAESFPFFKILYALHNTGRPEDTEPFPATLVGSTSTCDQAWRVTQLYGTGS